MVNNLNKMFDIYFFNQIYDNISLLFVDLYYNLQ
jgi:hypothetical protein